MFRGPDLQVHVILSNGPQALRGDLEVGCSELGFPVGRVGMTLKIFGSQEVVVCLSGAYYIKINIWGQRQFEGIF